MKNLTIAAIIIAAVVPLSIAPSFAMDNTAYEQSQKLQKALKMSKGAMHKADTMTRSTTFTSKAPMKLTRYEAAAHRLFKNRSEPSGR